MNAYIADSIARQHADAMLADAAIARRLRRARKNAKTRHVASSGTAASSASAEGAPTAGPLRTGSAVASVIVRPFTAAHSWLLAGQL